MQPDILVLGAGAVGAFYGAALARQGASVSVVIRSHVDDVARDGFDIRSPRGDEIFHPRRVLRTTAEVEAPPDYLLVSLKLTPDVDQVALMRPAVGPATTIVLIQNGVEIEGEVAEAFPDSELLSGVAYVAVARTGPRRVEHTAHGRLVLGAYPEGVTERARMLAALLEADGIPCKLTPDIRTARWQKCVWNMLNPLSVLAGGAGTRRMLERPEGEGVMRRAMEEVSSVAAAAGHPLPADLVDRIIEGTRGLPDVKNSMARDFLLGRPLEVEAILGNAVRAGHAHGVPVPVLDTVYGMLSLLLAEMAEGRET